MAVGKSGTEPAALAAGSGTGTASGTQAVDRAARLVATVVHADAPLTFAEIAQECRLPKSTTSRLLTALERTELVERNAAGSYVAGRLFWLYASRHDPWEEMARLAGPVLAAVGLEIGETVNLGVARTDRVVHVAQVNSRFLLGTRDWTQVEVPPHTSALGKVLYAFGALTLPVGDLEQLTARTVPDVEILGRELERARSHGYASTVDELEVGLTGVAAPVHGSHGEVVAALGVSGPTQRLESHLDQVGALLISQAEQLSVLLAHRIRREGVA